MKRQPPSRSNSMKHINMVRDDIQEELGNIAVELVFLRDAIDELDTPSKCFKASGIIMFIRSRLLDVESQSLPELSDNLPDDDKRPF